MEITATRCNVRSWEKVTYWKLSNGCTALEVYNQHYGPHIVSIEKGDKVWRASNGKPGDKHSIGGADNANKIFGKDKYIDLPEDFHSWVCDKGLVRLKAKIIHG